MSPRAGLGFLKKTHVSAANRTLHRPTRGLDTVQTTLTLLFSYSVQISDSLLLLSIYLPAFNIHPTDGFPLPGCDPNKVALNDRGSDIFRNVGSCLSQYSYMTLISHETTNVNLGNVVYCT